MAYVSCVCSHVYIIFNQIERTNLGTEPVQRTVTTNVWIGPSQVIKVD